MVFPSDQSFRPGPPKPSAVKQPGVFEVRTSRSVLEVLALAQGLADDAGDSALIVRADGTPPVEVKLSALKDSRDSALNVPVNPGDVVKVSRQGLIYVIGDVQKPGSFAIQGARRTALNALALSEGLTPTSAKKAVILRNGPDATRDTVEIDLDKVMKGIFETEITWSVLLIALATTMFVGIVSGLYPAYKASRLDPVEALRYE